MIAWLAAAAAGSTLADQAALHLRLDGRGVDQATVGVGYTALCEAGDELACKWRAWDDFGRVKRADLARLSEQACSEGRGEACLLVAWGLGLTDANRFAEGATDPERAVKLLRQACEADVPRACTELGVVLTEDLLVDPEPDEAKALHAKACAAGVPTGCLRAGDEEAAKKLGLPTTCEQGVIASCVAQLDEVQGEAKLPLLERLCHLDEAHCPALAEVRRTARGDEELPTGVPARVAFAGSDVLLGWDAASFQDHVLLDLKGLDGVQIRNLGARHEQVVLLGPGEREVVLPGERDCNEVTRLARGVAEAGVLLRVVDERGAPALSTCIDLLGPGVGPDYQGGNLAVDPVDPGDVGPATELKGVLIEHIDGLFACGDAASAGRTLDPLTVGVVHKRADRLAKLKPVASSGSDSFDQCVVDWLAGVPVEPAVVSAKHTVTVLLLW